MTTLYGISGLARSGKDTTANFIKDHINKTKGFCYKYGLADELKRQVNIIFGWTERHAYGDLKEVEVEKVISLSDVRKVLWNSFNDKLEGKSITTYDKIKVEYRLDILVNTWLCTMINNNVVKNSWMESGLLEFKASPRQIYQLHGTEFARNCISDSIWFDFAEDVLENKGGVMIVSDIRFPNEADWVLKKGGTLISVERDAREKIPSSAHSSEKHINKIKDKAMYIITNDGTLEDLKEDVRNILL